MDFAAVTRAALFPHSDIPPVPDGHPDRLVDVSGVRLALPAGLPYGIVFPERVHEDSIGSVVAEVRERLRAEERTQGVWFVPEAAEPTGLALLVQGLGMIPNSEPPFEPRFASMVTLDPPPRGESDVEVHPVRTLNEFRALHRVWAASFGLEGEQAAALEARAELTWPFQSEDGPHVTFAAAIAGVPVGFASASFGKTAGLLGGSGTHPDYRGRGVYRSMVRARWAAAVARGTPALTVGAGHMSRPILERLGFSIVGWNDILCDDLDRTN